ncbi:sterol carrier protein [Actinocorallia sp. B10E7]|uniref:sterol carrier protein n=1 Tax=Actinocorallia sp. B10E7 TaxID=3153558 RepID=UPI00325F57A0
MGVFKDASEVHVYLGGIFEKAMEDTELSAELAASGVVLRVGYTDPESQITVDMPNRKVYAGPCDLSPTVELFMSADMGNRFWLGKVNLPVAMAKGQVRAKGPVPKILKLIPVTKKLFPRYEEMLRAGGREDLINA